MKANTATSRGVLKRRLFGAFELRSNPENQLLKWKINFPRLAVVLSLGLFFAYGATAFGVYHWLRNTRKIDGVTFSDVALLKRGAIRREIGVKQFTDAREHLKNKDVKAAFVAINSGLRNAPDNVEGRVLAADLYHAAGLTERSIGLLEGGLARIPDNETLARRLFELLVSTGREQLALKLLRGKFAYLREGTQRNAARIFEVLASLSAEGPDAARRLLDGYGDLRNDPAARPVVARVLWENREPSAAIELLTAYVADQPDGYAAAAQLADYQEAAGRLVDARLTAEAAVKRFPGNIAVHVMLIGTLTPARMGEYERWRREVETFLKLHGKKPEALSMLADLAGRKGWVELARLIYETAASQLHESRMIALYYSDALARQKKFAEARRVLAEVDQQTHDDARVSLVLWQRQVVVPSAIGASEEARESARRLAAALHGDPVRLEHFRQRFLKMGMEDVAAEMAPSTSAASLEAAIKKS